MRLSQTTEYPWDGDIVVTVDQNGAGPFDMKIRIPGWVRNQVVPSNLYQYSDGKRLGYQVLVNGQAAEGQLTADGYYTISRKWKKGDKVQVHFDMEARTVRANNKVEADRGMVSIERGPLVYCAEHPDNNFRDIGNTRHHPYHQRADAELQRCRKTGGTGPDIETDSLLCLVPPRVRENACVAAARPQCHQSVATRHPCQ